MSQSIAGAGAERDAVGLGQDITACDREPIHIPGSIQPHGLLLVADPATRNVVAGAGDIEGRLDEAWLGKPLEALIGQELGGLLIKSELSPGAALALAPVQGRRETFQPLAHSSGDLLLVELEPTQEDPPSAGAVLSLLDAMAAAFGRAPDLRGLCEQAALAFRRLTGFDRVMIYRFLDDDAGTVLAEARAPELHSFMNHHFPASDIPKQARALYVRNRVRTIPDIGYEPAPLRPPSPAFRKLDLSDVALRSVSPIHIQYLKNMGLGASASVSIVKDGVLWGLVACHHRTPRALTYDVRMACQALAGGLARQIRAKEEAETYRERLTLRAAEDAVLGRLSREGSTRHAVAEVAEELRQMLGADGFAAVQGSEVAASGVRPSPAEIAELAGWLEDRWAGEPFSTHELGARSAPAASYRARASGLLAVTVPLDEPTILMWFRAEQVEEVNWAGNPHKAVDLVPGAALNPRTSFEAWSETVRGQSRPWTRPQIESAQRLRQALFELRQTDRLRELNRELAVTLTDKDSLLRQKDYLVKEVNHRVQNSLQLVSAFLALQSRAAADPILTAHLQEAERRLSAVALVHKRLYRDDNVESVDLARYLEDLVNEMKQSLGPELGNQIEFDLAPLLISTDRAVNVGLILTELVINAGKYAYGGGAGPISICLEQHRNRFRLIVGDHGGGAHDPGKGFGTRMIAAMVDRLSGDIAYEPNHPGLRAIVTAPIEDRPK